MDDEDKVEAILGLSKAYHFLLVCEDEEPVITSRDSTVGYRWAQWAVAEMTQTLTNNVQSKGYWRWQAAGRLFIAQEASREENDGNTRSNRPTEESPG